MFMVPLYNGTSIHAVRVAVAGSGPGAWRGGDEEKQTSEPASYSPSPVSAFLLISLPQTAR